MVTAGGFNATVTSEGGDEVLVAQLGPSGTFGSKALMGQGEAGATCAAAVDSEVFALTRDVFVAVQKDKGDASTLKSRLEALQKVPAFAQLPAPTLSRIAAASREVLLQPGQELFEAECAQTLGDNWLLLVTEGTLGLAHRGSEG